MNDTYLLTPGNIVLDGAKNISFVNSTFQHLGAFAVEARNGSQGIAWQGCLFRDASAGALSLGSISDHALNETDPSLWDRGMLVEDSEISNMPVELTGAAAIFSGYVGDLTIRHNYLVNQSYSGMNVRSATALQQPAVCPKKHVGHVWKPVLTRFGVDGATDWLGLGANRLRERECADKRESHRESDAAFVL